MFFFLSSFFFLLFSCATVSVQQSIETVLPQWESFAEGIDYFHGKISSPLIEFHALRINLSSPNINIAVSGGANTVSGFVSENNLIAGLNATPFDENHKNTGLVISDSTVLSAVNRNYDALVFFRDINSIRAVIVSQSSIYSAENIKNAVGGFHKILENGEPPERTLREGTVSAQRHPRSAAGVSQDGSVLYLVCIDGRRPGSIGATEMETALLLRALGAGDGLNLDGGGSSALALRFPDGNVRVVNTPNGIGRERTVAACIGFSLSTGK